MVAKLAAMSSSRHDLKQGHMPQSSFYSTSTMDDTSSPTEENYSTKIPATGVSIRQMREAAEKRVSMGPSPSVSQPTQKKRPSIFGGIFAKEPSMAALDQVASQMIGQPNSAIGRTVPHFTSQKMPDYVPKVNTKWDGVPEIVKSRDKQAKERHKAANRNSIRLSHNSRFDYLDTSKQQSIKRRSSNTASSDSQSFESQPMPYTYTKDRADSLYSTDSGASSQPLEQSLSSQSQSHRSQSYKSQSGTSLPKTTALYPDQDQEISLLRGLKIDADDTCIRDHSMKRPKQPTRTVSSNYDEPLPEYSTSPVVTPLEQSPRTPITMSHDPSRKNQIQPLDAFLAGEAKPFEISDDLPTSVSDLPTRPNVLSRVNSEQKHDSITKINKDLVKRPDSSRARLGLRASMVVQTDNTPWNSKSIESTSPQKSLSPKSPRGKFRFFGTEKV